MGSPGPLGSQGPPGPPGGVGPRGFPVSGYFSPFSRFHIDIRLCDAALMCTDHIVMQCISGARSLFYFSD